MVHGPIYVRLEIEITHLHVLKKKKKRKIYIEIWMAVKKLLRCLHVTLMAVTAVHVGNSVESVL